MEEEDLKQRLQKALACLPAADRTLIALHFYSGLSHGEMGAAMSLPRTTVQSRLGKALERLRGALAGLGCVVPASAIEAAMRATAPIEIPAGLAASLSTLPATAGGAASTASFAGFLGGLIVTKKVIAVAAVAGFLVLGGGAYWTGKQQGRIEMEAALAAGTTANAVSRSEQTDLLAENRKLSKEVQTLRSRLEAQSKGPARAPARKDAAASAQSAGHGGKNAGAGEKVVIDWSKLSGLLAERLDLIYELSEAGGDRQPTKEDRRLMAELDLVMKDVLSRARQISDNPFYDQGILLGLCEAMCMPALGLSGEQQAEVRAAIAGVFADHVEGFDPDAALPAETYLVRQGFLEGLDKAVGGSLDETQGKRWRKINALARRFLEGDSDRVAMPLAPEGGAAAREAGVFKEWQTAFSLAEGQRALVQPLASEFISGADAVLERYGQLDATPRELTALEKARLRAEVLDLQIKAEKQLLRHLTPEQREALAGRAPTILQFAPGNESWSDRRRGAPF